jgi:hypothetical protein
VPEPKYPFKITGSRAKIGDSIQFQVEESTVDGKNQFILNVKAERKLPGRFFDTIFLKTDNPLRSELPIVVYGQVMDAGPAIGPPKPEGANGVAPLPPILPETKPKP